MIKDGKEAGQGVAYLDDGTMIVVDGGKRHVGERLEVIVTSVLQTAAGRMIFAKPKEQFKKKSCMIIGENFMLKKENAAVSAIVPAGGRGSRMGGRYQQAVLETEKRDDSVTYLAGSCPP